MYTNLRLATKSSSADIWPPYNVVREAKINYRPPEEYIHVSKNEVHCDVQALLHHTTFRIVNMQKEVIIQSAQNVKSTNINAAFIFSWGFDGSTGFSSYKQRFSNSNEENDSNISDSSLFATTCIPLRLITSTGIVLWNNSTTQSVRFCRPISLKWLKETKETTLAQKKFIDDQFEELESFEIKVEDCFLQVHFSLHLTLIDGIVLKYNHWY